MSTVFYCIVKDFVCYTFVLLLASFPIPGFCPTFLLHALQW